MSTEDITLNLLMFLVGFLIIFIIVYALYTRKLKSKKKKKDIMEIRYLVTRFHLEETKLPKRKIYNQGNTETLNSLYINPLESLLYKHILINIDNTKHKNKIIFLFLKKKRIGSKR